MPNTPLENRKLSPWVTEAVKHWRWVEDRLHPLFEVTSPKYSGAWMDEVETRGICRVGRRLAERRFIERMRRIERNRIIDKMLAEAHSTGTDAFWRNFHEAEAADATEPTKIAEAKVHASVKHAAAFSRDVWGTPATQDDVKMRAELCAYWTGGYRDANGDLHLPDLTSKYLNERAVAELIATVLAPNS